MQLLKNLKFLGNFKKIAKPLQYDTDLEYNGPAYFKIVDEAIQAEFSNEDFLKIKDGFRRSKWNEDSLLTDIQRLNSDEHSVLKDQYYYDALKIVKEEYFTPDVPIQPVHFADLRRYPWELSTSVGAPFATNPKWQKYVEAKFDAQQTGSENKDAPEIPEFRDLFAEAHQGQTLDPKMIDARMSKRNLYNEAFTINRSHVHRIKAGNYYTEDGKTNYYYWNTAFARQHIVESEDPDKVRLVFGAPWLFLMIEMMFFWPLQAWILHQGERSPMLWGFETLTGGWYRLRNFFARTATRFKLCLTLDWSGFDRYARHTVIDDIYDVILRPMFTFENGYYPTRNNPETKTDPQRLQNLWTWMRNAVKEIPLVLPNGDTYRFRHSGIFSGYLQTQMLDSIYNLVMIYTILLRLGFKQHQIKLKVQGDDSIILILCCFLLVAPWLLNMFSYYASIYFGSKVSEKKSEIRQGLEDAEVLKYRNKGGLPYRDPLALLAQLRHPERSHKLTALKARAVGIAFANCGSDPRVYRVCERIFQTLDAQGIKSDASGLPDQIKFMNKFLRLKSTIDIETFPTYMDTVLDLMNERQSMPSNSYWNTSFFNGYPGEK